MYELSFTQEFFWNNSEHPEVTEKPTSIYESIYNVYASDVKRFKKMVFSVLGISLKNQCFCVDTFIHELTMSAIEYNTCRNLNTPVEVYLNEDYTVFVY